MKLTPRIVRSSHQILLPDVQGLFLHAFAVLIVLVRRFLFAFRFFSHCVGWRVRHFLRFGHVECARRNARRHNRFHCLNVDSWFDFELLIFRHCLSGLSNRLQFFKLSFLTYFFAIRKHLNRLNFVDHTINFYGQLFLFTFIYL